MAAGRALRPDGTTADGDDGDGQCDGGRTATEGTMATQRRCNGDGNSDDGDDGDDGDDNGNGDEDNGNADGNGWHNGDTAAMAAMGGATAHNW